MIRDPLPCPKCGSIFADIWKTVATKRYHVECRSCRYAGETKIFKWRAILSWNKEEIFDEREDTD